MTKKLIVVDRIALNNNKRIADAELHLAPFLIKVESLPIRKAFQLEIVGPSKVVYNPDDPLMMEDQEYVTWIETDGGVRTV